MIMMVSPAVVAAPSPGLKPPQPEPAGQQPAAARSRATASRAKAGRRGPGRRMPDRVSGESPTGPAQVTVRVTGTPRSAAAGPGSESRLSRTGSRRPGCRVRHFYNLQALKSQRAWPSHSVELIQNRQA